MKPKVCILRTDGTNCDQELFYAFEKFGARPEYVHVNELRKKGLPGGSASQRGERAGKKLKSYQILALPGGFSYGDDVASGKILAVELISFFKEDLQNFIENKGVILGVCNGFQTLVRTGLLPFNNLGKMDATLAQNTSGHFECRWVKIKIQKSRCSFLDPYVGQMIDIAVNHGEGRFFAETQNLKKVEDQNLVFSRYVDNEGENTQSYPQNPNGSTNAIAGVCDPTGRILGIMPHPEKIIELSQHPNWRRGEVEAKGGLFFEALIKFAREL